MWKITFWLVGIMALAMAYAARADPATQPTTQATERAETLKKDIKTFSLQLFYWGEENYDRLILSVPPLVERERNAFFDWRQAQITEDQAKKIIDYLATAGFLEGAKMPEPPGRPFSPGPRPAYVLSVSGGLWENLGWGLPMLQRLDGLRKVLDGDAATQMDLLRERLIWPQKEWEAAALAVQPAIKPMDGLLKKARPALVALQARCKSDPLLKPLAEAQIGQYQEYKGAGDFLLMQAQTSEQWDGLSYQGGPPERHHGAIAVSVYQEKPPERQIWGCPYDLPPPVWWGHTWLHVSDSQAVLVHSMMGDPAVHSRLVNMVVEELAKAGIGTQIRSHPVPFDTHTGYIVSDEFEPDQAESFTVLKDQKAFDEIFEAVTIKNKTFHRLPAETFPFFTKMAVATIKRGKVGQEFTVKEVVEDNGVLRISYTTTPARQASAEFASPLIVRVPKGDYTAVEFVENGKSIKRIEIKKAAAQPRVSR